MALIASVFAQVNQSRFINSATNLANIPELDALTAFAEVSPCSKYRLTS